METSLSSIRTEEISEILVEWKASRGFFMNSRMLNFPKNDRTDEHFKAQP